MLFLAAVGAGGVFTGTNPSYTHLELSHHLKTARVKFLISEPEILDNLIAAAKDNDISPSRLWVFNTNGRSVPSGHRAWDELMTHGEEDWLRFNSYETSSTTTAARLFSSGTTGLPKAAVLTHLNLIAQHMAVFEQVTSPYQVCPLSYNCHASMPWLGKNSMVLMIPSRRHLSSQFRAFMHQQYHLRMSVP